LLLLLLSVLLLSSMLLLLLLLLLLLSVLLLSGMLLLLLLLGSEIRCLVPTPPRFLLGPAHASRLLRLMLFKRTLCGGSQECCCS
jgi:hypothetical protein